MTRSVYEIFQELESLLVEVERLTMTLIAGLAQAPDHIEEGLTPELIQASLLRGSLLHQAHALSNTVTLAPEDHQRLLKKLQQLNHFDTRLGVALDAHHRLLRGELQKTMTAQAQLKVYHVQDTPPEHYLEEA